MWHFSCQLNYKNTKNKLPLLHFLIVVLIEIIREGLLKMTSLYSLTAEVLTTRSLLNNDVRTAITTNEYDYNEDTRLP